MTVGNDTRTRGLFKIGNKYYISVNIDGKRIRKSTGRTDLDGALRFLAKYSDEKIANIAAERLISHKRWIYNILNSLQARNRKMRCPPMPREHLEFIIKRSQGRCEVTGIPFDWGSDMREPYAPSVDRIDPKRGYSLDNCRMVCLSVNMAMNVWGEDVLLTIGQAMIAKRTTDEAIARVRGWAQNRGRQYEPVETAE